jgi:2-polyprenyl-3-methyl-5-hydroxy-6-metoxy-1,4-benzoquinol methylase
VKKKKVHEMEIIERIDPLLHKKDLMYPEHLGRYVFAAQFVRDKTVLDAACGNGYGSYYLADCGKAARVFGVDLAEEAIDYSRKHYQLQNIEFIQGDAENLTAIRDGSMDVVVSFETIEHLADYYAYLREIARVLKPGGILVISCPNDFIFNPDNPYHLHKFNLEEFQSLLKNKFKHIQFFAQNNMLGTSIMDSGEVAGVHGGSPDRGGQLLPVDKKEYSRADTWLAVCSGAPLPRPLPVAAYLNEYSSYVKEIEEANLSLYEENKRLLADSSKINEENQKLAAAWTEHVNTINVHIDYIKRLEAENKRMAGELARSGK